MKLGKKRFGTSLKRHEKRRRRHLLPETGSDDVISSTGTVSGDSWEVDEEDLSTLDFSQVFVPAADVARKGKGMRDEPAEGFVLGRRAHHLVNLLAQPDTCLVRNILHIWNFDLDRIRSLDQRQILIDVNEALLKGSVKCFFHFFFIFFKFNGFNLICGSDDSVDESEVESLELLMSDVRRDANGTVFYVGATMMTWLLDNSHLTVSKK